MMMSSFLVSGVAIAAEKFGCLAWYLVAETTMAIIICFGLTKTIDALKWPLSE